MTHSLIHGSANQKAGICVNRHPLNNRWETLDGIPSNSTNKGIGMQYQEFIESKRIVAGAFGVEVEPGAINAKLFEFQRAIVRWALRKGRAAIFADTGLGKSFMQVEWARQIAKCALIVAPLSVARQTVGEAAKLGVTVTYVRNQSQVAGEGIYITNYEMIEHFDPSAFDAVVLDESSILKALDGSTRQRLTEMFEDTPYRLCCTATPAPNDIVEIGNHAEFLGIMRTSEMKGAFFIHDDDGWRLRKHGEQAFYRWLASWSMAVRKPSDLGFSDEGYILPSLTVAPMWVQTGYQPEDSLFFTGLDGIQGRNKVRKATIGERVEAAAALVNNSDEQWLVWCGLNDESDALAAAIPDGVVVEGSMTPEQKIERIEAFQRGEVRVLITKAKIAGFGMNFQNCHNQIFVGLSDSFEAYYQCIRRSWRFGQIEPVTVRIVLAEEEDAIYQNVLRKEAEAIEMSVKLIEHVRDYEKEELQSSTNGRQEYVTDTAHGEAWTLMLGDSAERWREVEADTVGFSVYSPPFSSLFTYSASERDLGNSRNNEQFFDHYKYIIREILRTTMPGRLTAVHVQQIAAMLERDGYIGIKDFRGDVIRAYEAEGWIYHGEVCVDKDPQAQAIRTKSKALLFVQLHKDSSWSRPALADYILLFRKPGTNQEPVKPDINNNEWIEWARPIWYGIKESDTLQYTTARSAEDERHICPLQLGTIERCIRLWSNPGDLVASLFAGIGSEGHEAVRLGRRFVGCELKPSYYRIAVQNLQNVEIKTPTLFDLEAA